MSLARIGAVVRKELREFRRNRFVIGTMAVLPLVFLITPMITLFSIPDSALRLTVEPLVGVISLLLLIVPVGDPADHRRLLGRSANATKEHSSRS